MSSITCVCAVYVRAKVSWSPLTLFSEKYLLAILSTTSCGGAVPHPDIMMFPYFKHSNISKILSEHCQCDNYMRTLDMGPTKGTMVRTF